MAISFRVHLPRQKAKEKELTEQLERLREIPLLGENCYVFVGVRAESGDPIDPFMSIVRQQETMVWSDGWVISKGGDGNSFQYRRGFGFPEPTTPEIVDSVKRMLEAPVLEEAK